MTGRNERVTEGACRSCHGEITACIAVLGRGDIACVRCHFDVGHSAASYSPASALAEDQRYAAKQ